MELTAQIQNKTKHIVFNAKAVKSIELRDDILYLSYMTESGKQEELVFPDIGDAHYFLSQTVIGYQYHVISARMLQSFLNSIELPLKQRIKSTKPGYGKTNNLNFCRFVIAEAIENLLMIASSKVNCTIDNLIKIDVVPSENAACFYYHNVRKKSTPEDYFILREGEPDYNEFKSFAYSCLPDVHFDQLTFNDADTLCHQLLSMQLQEFTSSYGEKTA